jgi:DNA-binding NarL/FixJ family response regulator
MNIFAIHSIIMGNVNLFIVDDHDVVITGVEAVLSVYEEFTVIGSANMGYEALEKLSSLDPDIVIMDVKLPDVSGIELTRILSVKYPKIKVILHTSFIDEENIINGFQAGAMGYVPKTFKVSDLVEAIRTVFLGQKYLKGIVSQVVIDSLLKTKYPENFQVNNNALSEREKEIIKYISLGMLNKQIAGKLSISQRTVDAHKSNIMKKLKISSKAELIVYAIKNDIIKI